MGKALLVVTAVTVSVFVVATELARRGNPTRAPTVAITAIDALRHTAAQRLLNFNDDEVEPAVHRVETAQR